MNAYDVIIAGCGPAGATAGYILARHGLKTAMIDRAVFPRPKLCGGLLPLKTTDLLARVFGETRESLATSGIINYTSNGYQIFYRQKLLVEKTTDLPFSFIDRETYDHFLLEKARSQGADVFEGERLTGIDADGGVLRTSSGRHYQARFIIGADGVHSAVRKCLPESRQGTGHRSRNLAAALEVFVPRTRLCRNMEHPMVHLGYVDWGYAWVFPNRDRVVIGLGGLPGRNTKNFREILHEYLSGLNILQPGEDVRSLRIHGYPIPYGSMAMRPVCGNIMLTGDAAGFADPITGEGIYYAHRSAEMAAMGIIRSLESGFSVEDIYLKLLRKHVFPDLLCAWQLRTIVFNALRFLPPALIGKLVQWGDTRALNVIHGLKAYPLNRKANEMHGDIQV